jgi:hypothetical protein
LQLQKPFFNTNGRFFGGKMMGLLNFSSHFTRNTEGPLFNG